MQNRKEDLITVMREELIKKGYFPTDDMLEELWQVYEDCQEWADNIMTTGASEDEVIDFVRESPCVQEVFSDLITINVTHAKIQRVDRQFKVTKEQLRDIEEGENIFYDIMNAEIENGTIDYDYSIRYPDGKIIVPWD